MSKIYDLRIQLIIQSNEEFREAVKDSVYDSIIEVTK
jgi:hypothetical protein